MVIKKNKSQNSKSHTKPSKKRKLSQKVKKLIVKKIMTDKQMDDKEGEYFDEKHYKHIIKSNCDCYREDDEGNQHLLATFRRSVLPDKLCKIGIKCLKKAAQKTHDNRGASAGIIDFKQLEKLPTYANQPKQFNRVDKFRIMGYKSKESGKWVNNSFGNISMSNIMGYFDKRDRNLGDNAPPCRTTAFTSQQVEKWKKVIPLIKSIDKQFKLLIPDKYKIQYNRARKTPWYINGTSFSTVTINFNWRTALHQDSGDLDEGFGNLVVLEEGKYTGGYTGFPQYGVCVDVRHGDFLGMDVHEWHCNTKIKPITKDYSRLSLVCYLRKNMIKCSGMKIPQPNKKY